MKHAVASRMVLLFMVFVVVGCDQSVPTLTQEPDILFPRQNPTFDVMEALLSGNLVEQAGCLRIEMAGNSESVVPIWPADYTLSSRNGTLVILDGSQQAKVQVGEAVLLSGGFVQSLNDSPAVSNEISRKVQQRCPGSYWLVGSEVGPAPR